MSAHSQLAPPVVSSLENRLKGRCLMSSSCAHWLHHAGWRWWRWWRWWWRWWRRGWRGWRWRWRCMCDAAGLASTEWRRVCPADWQKALGAQLMLSYGSGLARRGEKQTIPPTFLQRGERREERGVMWCDVNTWWHSDTLTLRAELWQTHQLW